MKRALSHAFVVVSGFAAALIFACAGVLWFAVLLLWLGGR